MDLKQSKTYANLEAAFAGESMARNKYTYFASQAKKDGLEQISAIFLETAENEKEQQEEEEQGAVGPDPYKIVPFLVCPVYIPHLKHLCL